MSETSIALKTFTWVTCNGAETSIFSILVAFLMRVSIYHMHDKQDFILAFAKLGDHPVSLCSNNLSYKSFRHKENR